MLVKDCRTLTAAFDLAKRAEDLKTSFIGLQLSVPALLDPRLPLLKYYEVDLEIPPEAPAEVYRQDGTMHSDESIGAILRRAATLPGAGLEGDLLPMIAMHGAIRLGDDLLQAGLMGKDEPLLQFARHLRNACAHGNRWHFQDEEPKHPAELRGRRLDASLHGSQAMYGWLGPGDYLDFLDDLAALLRTGTAK